MEPVLVFPHLGARLGMEITKLAEVDLVLVNHLLVCHQVADLCGLVITLVTLVPDTQVDRLHVTLEVRLLFELFPTVTARVSQSILVSFIFFIFLGSLG